MRVESRVELRNPGEKENRDSREPQFTHWTAVNNRVVLGVVEEMAQRFGILRLWMHCLLACRPKAGSEVARAVVKLRDPIRNNRSLGQHRG